MDESFRELLREAEHAHDASLWLRAGSAAARMHAFEEAGRALLHARALGAETGPVDDALAPATLEHERRGVGALLTNGPLACMGWAPTSDRLYAVTGDRRILALGADPGQNERVVDLVHGRSVAIGATLANEVVVAWVGDTADPTSPIAGGAWFVDVAQRRVTRRENTGGYAPSAISAFGDRVVLWSRREMLRIHSPERIQTFFERLDGVVVTWAGQTVGPPRAERGAPKTLRFVFSTFEGRLEFPTKRSVDRFVELATIERTGLNPNEIVAACTCIAASPSGRDVAFAGRSVRLVDLVTGEHRTLELDQTAIDARWSPSGRRLAVLTPLRVHVFTFTS